MVTRFFEHFRVTVKRLFNAERNIGGEFFFFEISLQVPYDGKRTTEAPITS